ncbi:T9SS type A sorting domain-containing protein [Winogradskyella echinorum]|uniref:T9SS type A sorting domain-containing protein n=1 Tax=Winogradskyella echinorum TaxID=538189 RepID=A0ABR6Y1X6_9FLAO|nr:Calx-beta domain-containing protein [Winogradskyella echinorum]MBC3846744.1 T9SS type A sorting domain-containing protein [Winogradskyella echinorum]MBC5751092.1 T9SS type A sorting domain-containing protein [Winogradskyella echinorum]
MKKIILLLILVCQSFLSFSQDPTVNIVSTLNSYPLIEGDIFTFKISLNMPTNSDVILNIETIADTADETDYTSLTTTVIIPAGDLSSNELSIATNNDSVIEENESFSIEASVTSNNTHNIDISQSIILWDNDTTPTVETWPTRNLIEGQGFTFSVSLSNYYREDITIDLTTLPGSADVSDYITTTTILTIPAGKLDASYTISTIEDDTPEEDEIYTINFTVTSGNTTNSFFEVIVTILDNDTIPTLSFVQYHYSESNPASVRIIMDRVFNSDVIIQLETSNGTADDSDYTDILQTKTIEVGDDDVVFQIPVIDDDIDEPQETINFIATVFSGNTTNNSESGIVTIIDNDGLPDFYLARVYNPNTGESDDSLVAVEGYELQFVPRLTHPSTIDTEIQITTTNGTADNSDYTTSIITTTIPAGQDYNNEILSYPTILDQQDEDDENIFINAVVTSENTYNNEYTLEGIILDNYHLNAQPDNITAVLEVGATFQVLNNDTFEGLPVNPLDLNVSLVSTNTFGFSLSPSGVLTIPVDLSIGNYYLDYEICLAANTTNCDIARIIVEVESPIQTIVTIAYNDFNGDGYTSVGDTIEFDFAVTNNGNLPVTNIDGFASYPQNINIVGGPLASLDTGEMDNTTFSAMHIITQNDINFGFHIFSWFGVINFLGTYYDSEVIESVYPEFSLERSDGLKLNAFVDTNGNGTQEADEINFPLGQFNYEINNDGVVNNLYVSLHYLYESNPNSTYDLSYTIDSDYTAYYATNANFIDITIPEGSNITTYDFPITVSSYADLAIEVSASLQPPMPGFEYWNYISYTNNSNETVTSGTINFIIDEALDLLNVYEAPDYLNADNIASIATTSEGFSYVFNDLGPFETKNLWVRMQVPTLPTVSLGQLITNTVDIELLSGDILPLNNASDLTQTIVGSYDPNDITEKHGEEIVYSTFTTDDYLTYTIRFENTGTANAINVRIEDVLDDQLDESTLKMVDASHSYTLERVGKYLEWNFAGIDLPPSEDNIDSQIGHGFITFKIKPFPDYEIGDVILNTAEIYFDFNPAIVTNTWTTTFVESLGTAESELKMIKMYPNPVEDKLQISNNSVLTSLEITSIHGKQIFTKIINDTGVEIDMSGFESGIYFIRVISLNQERVMKLIKQ